MAKKSFAPLCEALAELMENGEGKSVPSQVVFLNVKKEVEEAMADGWTVKSLWNVLTKQGRIAFSYPSFTRYVRKHLRNRNTETKSEGKDEKQTMPPKVTVTPQGRVMPDWPKLGFAQSTLPKFDPNTYRGEIPVYGSKPKPEDFNKF